MASSARARKGLTPPRYGRAYLQSAWWAELHEAYARHPRTPKSCAVCGAIRYELHHRTYANLGHEHVHDLLALCRSHHGALHRGFRTSQRHQPELALEDFTDAWVEIQRRRYKTALLPDVSYYRRPKNTSNTATAASQTAATSSTVRVSTR